MPNIMTVVPEHVTDAKTRALLHYASKLTEAPSLVGKDNIGALTDRGWNEREILGDLGAHLFLQLQRPAGSSLWSAS